MEWLRMHHEARIDKKLASLNDAQFRVWFNLLLYSGEQEERGTVPVPDDELLALEVSGSDVDLLHDTVGRLVRLRIVERTESGLRFCNWEKRQPTSDSSTERVRKHRERKRNGDETVTETVTQRPGNGGATDGNALEQNRADTDKSRADNTPPAPAREDESPPDGFGDGGYDPDFDALWDEYPVKLDKGAAYKAYKARRKERHTTEAMRAAVRNYAAYARASPLRVKHGSTFLGPTRPFLEWVDGIPADAKREMGAGPNGNPHGYATGRRTGAFGAGTGPGGTSVYDRFVQRDDPDDEDEDVPEVRAGSARAAP